MRTIEQAAGLALLALAVPSLAFGQFTHQPIAFSGEPAPGTGDSFLRFSNPIINASGEVAFQANLAGPTAGGVVPHGIWAGSRAALFPLAIAGQTAPGVGSAKFRTVGWPLVLTDSGQSIFYGQLVNGGAVTPDNDYGVWAGSAQNMQLVARKPDQAPGLPAGIKYSLFFASPHASGSMGFSASLTGPGVNENNNSAAWVGPIGPAASLELLVRGDPAPGLPADTPFTSVGTPLVNAAGQVTLLATAKPAAAAYKTGIWFGVPHQLNVIAIQDADALGIPGRSFYYFAPPRLNNAGQVAFAGYLNANSDEEQLYNVGIWAGRASPNAIQAIAVEGQQAPGFDPGVVFRGSAPGDLISYDPFTNPTLGSAGHVAFAATVFGDQQGFFNNDGIWISSPPDPNGIRSLKIIVREGDPAPGAPEGTLFSGIFNFDDLIPAFEKPLINAAGQVAFEASTRGPTGNGRGIWATDLAGELQLVAYTGETYIDPDGISHQVDVLKLNPGGSSDEGYLSAFNDAGQLAFGATFTDGTEGIFVATIVPEPSVVVWIPAVLALAAARRPRRK